MTGVSNEIRSESASGAYAAVQDRTTELVSGLPPARLSARVPACPDWTVSDVLAHVSGAAHDVSTGNIEGVGSDPWTARQVAERRGRDTAELVAEWRAAAATPMLQAVLASPGRGQIVMDVLTHELDLRSALDRPLEAGPDELGHALTFSTRQFGRNLQKQLGLAPVLVRTELGDWPLGLGEPALTLDLSAVDLLRTITGRRTWEQISALGWPEEYRPAFTWAVFTPPAEATEPG